MNFNNQIHHIPPFPPGGVPTFRAFPTLPPKPARVPSPPSDEPPRASPPNDDEHPIIGSNIFQGVHQQRQHEGPSSPQSPPDDDTAPMPRASAITRRPPLLKKKQVPEDSVGQAAAAPTTVTTAVPEVPPPAAARPLLGSLFGANAAKGKKGQSKSAVPVPTKSIMAAAAPPPATIDSIYKKPISPKAPPAKPSSLDTKVKPFSKGKSARRKKHDTSDSSSSDSDEVSRRRIKKEAHSSESSDHSSGRGSKRSYSTDSDRSKRYRKKKSRRVESRRSRSRSRSNSSDRVAKERKKQHLASHAGEGILAPPTGGFRPINSSNYAITPYLGNTTNNMHNAIQTNSMMMNTQQGMHHNQQNSYNWSQNQHDGGQSFDHSATNMNFGDSQGSYANPLPNNNGPNNFETNSVPSKTNNINNQASNQPILAHPPAPAAPSTAGFSPDQWLGVMQKFMEKQSTAPPKGTESDTTVPLLPPPPPPPSTQLVEAIANNVHEHFTNLTAGVYALIDEMRGQRQEAQDALIAQREDARQLMQLHQQEAEAHREEIAVLRSEVKLMKGELMTRLLQLNGDTFEALAAVLQDPNFAASAILQLTRQRCGGLSGCGSYSFPDPARFAVQGYRKVTLLHMAVHCGRLDVIKAIFVASNPSSAVAEAVNPEAGLESGKYTALHLAATHSGGPYPDIIRCLVNNGADINCADEEGWTPLMYACRANLMDIANTLLQFRPHQRAAGQYEDEPATGPEVDVNAACVTQGHTSLHFAAMNANADLCNALCLLGANPLALASFGSGQPHNEFGAKKGLTPRASMVTNDAETLKVLMHWENLALASGRSHITFH